MKKIVLVLFCLLPFIGNAQDLPSFLITPKGFISSTDSSKNYIVLNFPGKTKAGLYKKALVCLSGLSTDPKNTISEIEGESISYRFAMKYGVFNSIEYLVEISFRYQFKDGAIKIEQPNLDRISFYNSTSGGTETVTINPDNRTGNRPLYKRNGSGELRGKDGAKGKQRIEDLVNSINKLFFEELTKADKNDW